MGDYCDTCLNVLTLAFDEPCRSCKAGSHYVNIRETKWDEFIPFGEEVEVEEEE